MNLRDRVTLFAFESAWRLLPRLAPARVDRLFTVLSDLAWLRHGPSVRQLEANLARVTGQPHDSDAMRRLSRTSMRSYGAYWAALFGLSGLSDADIARRVQVHGLHNLDGAMAAGRGVVIAAAHAGNWDLAGAWLGGHCAGLTTVAERLRPEELFQLFIEQRARYGVEILPHRGGPRPPLEVLTERLQAGGVIALVCDRDLSRRGVEVQFFGATARMAAGPATLALRTGAALLVAGMWVEGDVLHLRFHPPLAPAVDADEASAIARTSQMVADIFEADIAAHPTDWHMLQRVWVEA